MAKIVKPILLLLGLIALLRTPVVFAEPALFQLSLKDVPVENGKKLEMTYQEIERQPESSIIEITRRDAPALGPDVEPRDLFDIVRTAFGQRRKMLRRSLSSITTPEIFVAADVAPEARPEELDVDQWGRLTRTIVGTRS